MTSDNPYHVPTNPYAAPATETGTAVGHNGVVGVRDKLLLARNPATLPQRCFKTNRTEDLVPVTRTLHWAPGWIYLLLLLNIIILLIVYLIVKKSIRVTYYVDRQTRRNYMMRIAIGLAATVGGFGLFIAGISNDEPSMLIAGLGIGFLALVVTAFMSTWNLRPSGYDSGVFRLKGCGPEFLQETAASESVPGW